MVCRTACRILGSMFNRFNSMLFRFTSFLVLIFAIQSAQAEVNRSPSDVYANIKYADKLLEGILSAKGITIEKLPDSHEIKVLPMHVYELHIASLQQLYRYALANGLTPPPLPTSTPIKYTPRDVYFLTEILVERLESFSLEEGITNTPYKDLYANKTPVDVYDVLFDVYYKLHRLNGKATISPNEVYAQVVRAKEDVQNNLLTIAKNLPKSEEAKKRQLVTAIYGLSPDGNSLPPKREGKKPYDVIMIGFKVREKLNTLRKIYSLPEIAIPKIDQYKAVKPVDVFLQTQFIIAELNLIKIPLNISSITNSPKEFDGKTPSDVYYEFEHLEYMLDRLIEVQ